MAARKPAGSTGWTYSDVEQAFDVLRNQFERAGAEAIEFLRFDRTDWSKPWIRLAMKDESGPFTVTLSSETTTDLLASLVTHLRRRHGRDRMGLSRLSDSMIGLWSELELMRSREPELKDIVL